MKTSRQRQGFTMMEMLIAVSILTILMAVGFIALTQHQKNLKRLELDKTAKEIFIAAQNHLTMADSQDLIEGKTSKGYSPPGAPPEMKYYFVVGPSENELDPTNSVSRSSALYTMLPYGSIDDTVRRGGSYVIQYNPTTAAVISVFYMDGTQLGADRPGFRIQDYTALYSDYAGDEDNAPANRMSFTGTGWGSSAIIGWYDGTGLVDRNPAQLKKPKISVRNAEKLEVVLDRSSVSRLDADGHEVAGVSVRVIMRGATSGAYRTIYDKSYTEFNGAYPTSDASWTIDDITSSGGQFASRWASGSDPLIPGEDLIFYAEVYSNSALSSVATSNTARANSLFASTYIDTTAGSPGVRIARVTNIRHLENIDPSISGYAVESLDTAFGASAPGAARRFVQMARTGELSWPEFKSAINSAAPAGVKVYRLGDTTGHEYIPVLPVYTDNTGSKHHYLKAYDGSGQTISDIETSESAHAGLFASVEGTVAEPTTIANLELRNFKVNATAASGNAGALAGTLKNVAVSNVVAYNTASDDSGYEIKGSGSVGGLVGSMSGGAIENSSASLYVQSTGGAAGGLVGSVSDATIKNAYSGGHTKDGAYLSELTASGQGRLNVQAAASTGSVAGGLIGQASGSCTIENTYSTCSAAGSTVGGLVGSIAAGSIKNSYSTGIAIGIGDSAKVGGFAGSNSSASFNSCHYLDTNSFTTVSASALQPVAGQNAVTGISRADTDISTYQAITGAKAAVPYDNMLKTTYGSLYPYKTVSELTGSAGPDKHYGDWPALETLVVNTKSATKPAGSD